MMVEVFLMKWRFPSACFFGFVYNQWSIQPTTIVYWSSECFIIDAGLFFKCTTSRSKWQIIRSWVMKQALWIAVMERNQLNVFTELSIIRFLFSVTKPRPNMIDFCKPDGKTWVCICQVCPHSASAVSEEFVLCGDTLVSIACLWAWRSRVWIHLVIFFYYFLIGLGWTWNGYHKMFWDVMAIIISTTLSTDCQI